MFCVCLANKVASKGSALCLQYTFQYLFENEANVLSDKNPALSKHVRELVYVLSAKSSQTSIGMI